MTVAPRRSRVSSSRVSSSRVFAGPRPLWAEVDPGFHVGNDRRQFLGSVKGTVAEGYTAFGPASDFIGRFDDLDAAKAAVVMAARTGSAPAPRTLAH